MIQLYGMDNTGESAIGRSGNLILLGEKRGRQEAILEVYCWRVSD
jgi:hypothetical protein